jgi:hypothetical protein
MAPRYDTYHWDHTNWLCENESATEPGENCNNVERLRYRRCRACGHRRQVGTEALNSRGDTIGELLEITRDGREFWRYF